MSDDNIKDLLKADDPAKVDKELAPDQSIDKLADQSSLSAERVSQLTKDQQLETDFGDSAARTFGESVLSGASFGLSDQALVKSGLTTQEALRERRERNAKSAIAGEIAGVVGPALLSGGSNLLAKGVASGVKGAAKAAAATEQLTAKALDKLIADTGKKSLAKEVLRKSIAKGAGSAVEGSFYGAGKLISEDALGREDFNAENLVAHAGVGAVLGGIAGGALGITEALIPIVKGGKVTGFINKKVKGLADEVDNTLELAGFTSSQKQQLLKFKPETASNMPKMFKSFANKKKITQLTSNDKIHSALSTHIDDIGSEIGEELTHIGSKLQHRGIQPLESDLAGKVIKHLEQLKTKFTDKSGAALSTAQAEVKSINKILSEWNSKLIAPRKAITPIELNNLKTKYQKLSKWSKKGSLPIKEDINRSISRAVREEVVTLADSVSGPEGTKLRDLMGDYASAMEFQDAFGKKINSPASKDFLNVKELLLGAAVGDITAGGIGAAAAIGNRFLRSDFKRKMILLTDVEKANTIITNKLNKGIKTFFKSGKRVAIPTSTKALLLSGLGRSYNDEKKTSKKPKTKKEAFTNVKENLERMSNPEKMNTFTKRGNLEIIAPKTSSHSQTILTSAILFLQEKLPKDAASTGAFSNLLRKYEPSTLELAKFEKYVQAIENPLSVIEDLQSGTVTRESIEAIKAVYPNLYSRIQESVMDQVQEDPEAVTYEKRLQLGILLDIPTDTSLDPSNIAALQSHFKETEESQAGGALQSNTKSTNNPVPAGRAAKLDLAESTATGVQKVSNRSDLN